MTEELSIEQLKLRIEDKKRAEQWAKDSINHGHSGPLEKTGISTEEAFTSTEISSIFRDKFGKLWSKKGNRMTLLGDDATGLFPK